jgi:hypothetical protein
MLPNRLVIRLGSVAIVLSAMSAGQPAIAQAPTATDPVKVLVGRLDLESYKATIKGLAQFGDRREGTARNRAAVDWIEAQLQSYGCTNTERVKYFYNSPPRPPQPSAAPVR